MFSILYLIFILVGYFLLAGRISEKNNLVNIVQGSSSRKIVSTVNSLK